MIAVITENDVVVKRKKVLNALRKKNIFSSPRAHADLGEW